MDITTDRLRMLVKKWQVRENNAKHFFQIFLNQ
jgi:hypothetical protein